MHSTIDLDKIDAAPVDAATKAAIEEGLAAADRGEIVTQEQADINFRKRLNAWRSARVEAARPQ